MIEILKNEKHYVIVVKPAGVLSQTATDGKSEDMVSLLSKQLDCEIFPVHRLDRETAGVMVYAKTGAGAAKFSQLVADGGLDKRYFALVEGKPEPEAGRMEDLLYHDVRKNKSYVVKRKRNGVRQASLDYTLVKIGTIETQTVSLVDVHLHTGRTHQIRVQFSSRQMPLVGDTRYGSRIKGDMCLFAARLIFTDPFTGADVSVESMPKDGILADFCKKS